MATSRQLKLVFRILAFFKHLWCQRYKRCFSECLHLSSSKRLSGRSGAHRKATFPLSCLKKLLMLLKPLEVLREKQILYIFHSPRGCTVKPKMRRLSSAKRKRLNKYETCASLINEVLATRSWGQFLSEKTWYFSSAKSLMNNEGTMLKDTPQKSGSVRPPDLRVSLKG